MFVHVAFLFALLPDAVSASVNPWRSVGAGRQTGAEADLQYTYTAVRGRGGNCLDPREERPDFSGLAGLVAVALASALARALAGSASAFALSGDCQRPRRHPRRGK